MATKLTKAAPAAASIVADLPEPDPGCVWMLHPEHSPVQINVASGSVDVMRESGWLPANEGAAT